MKLSISNLAWDIKDNQTVCKLLRKHNCAGLEIAPTKIFPQNPYDKLSEIKKWKDDLFNEYGIKISSMQSLLYGHPEQIFKSSEERDFLFQYLKKAVDFAEVTDCKNLVFGCPRNRNISQKSDIDTAIDFFGKLGDYAYSKGTAIGFEAIPAASTNFINKTKDAVNFIRKVNSKGLMLNLDIGTMISNNETLNVLDDNFDLINHVHLSEPNLENIKERKMHKDLIEMLKTNNYNRYISLEIKLQKNISDIEKPLLYIKGLL